MSFKLAEYNSRAKIKVIGVGGGGGNAINTMVENELQGVEFIAVNTDLQALERSRADIQLQMGPAVTKGLGAGANPELGRESAEESIEELREILKDCDMIFVTAGLGGGTGTGAAPVIARIGKELGALTVAVVTKPFLFEGKARMRNAEKGWDSLKEQVDTIITIPNDRLLSVAQKGTTFIKMMKMADDVLVQAVKGITDTINLTGYINPDFADIKAIMNEMGPALMGAGQSVGENRAVEAINDAIASPLLQDISIEGAKGVLVSISAREDSLSMVEVTEVTTKIHEEVHEDANIILGVTFDDNLGDSFRVTVIATGIKPAQELEQLSSNITPIMRQKQASELPPALPQSDAVIEQQQVSAVGSGGVSGSNSIMTGENRAKRQMPLRFQPRMSEDELDKPTFMRKNEN
jgi:cell division protein FtsZ